MANAAAPVVVPGAAPAAAPLAFSTEVNLAQPLSWFGSGSGSEYTSQQFIHEIDQRRIRCGWTDAQTLSFVGVCLKGGRSTGSGVRPALPNPPPTEMLSLEGGPTLGPTSKPYSSVHI